MSKSIFTMSAAQRLKAQQRQSRRFDRAVNRKFKAMKKAWKRKIAGRVVKGAAFVATAAMAGAVAGKVKEVILTKSGDGLREMASKIKVKFDEKMAERKSGQRTESEALRAAEAGAKAGRATADGVRQAQEVNRCHPLDDTAGSN